MIIEYLRPKSLKEAVSLVSRSSPLTKPMGGGTSMKSRSAVNDFSVVDLQALGLDAIIKDPDWIELGAMATLRSIENHPDVPAVIKKSMQLEGTVNTRNRATLGGRLAAFDGRSALITTLLAADVVTIWDEDRKELPLGEWLALPAERPGRLLLAVKIDCKVKLAMEVVNRTKLDLPILCVAAAKWPAGRTRLTVGGFGTCPQMAFDGSGVEGAELAVENVCRNSGDFSASEEYRRAMSIVLTRRCLANLQDS